MNAIRVETTIQTDGELHLTDLPFRQGDRIEAIVLVLEPAAESAQGDRTRGEALQRFLDRARNAYTRTLVLPQQEKPAPPA